MNLENKLNDLFESYGYKKYNMTKFEEYDLYAEHKDFLMASQIVTFNDIDGKLLALKPDITLSIIKNSTSKRERLYYNENVYRPRDGHFKEIPQAGVECIGHIGLFEEAEIISLAASSLGLISDDYIIRISDIDILDALFDELRVSDHVRAELIRDISDKNISEIKSKLSKGLISNKVADTITSLIEVYVSFSGDIRGALEFLGNISDDSSKFETLLARLLEFQDIIASFGISDKVYLDFSLINSMDYYNKIIFQGSISHIPFVILSGGRYDKIPETMNKSELGAIGFALYMDIIASYYSEKTKKATGTIIKYEDGEDLAALAKKVATLRANGENVSVIHAAEVEND